jgi:hypothetical protein
MNKVLLFSLMLLLIFSFFVESANADTCLAGYTMSEKDVQVNGVLVNVTVSCPFGCRPDTGGCFGTDATGSINAMWIIYATGSLFLVLATILGIPYGKMTGGEEIKSGFDTTIVIKYIFFFVGIYLMYLSLSMSYRNVNIYGGESGILGGTNTAVMVIMITLILFIFVFVIETLFWILKRSLTIKEEEKWGERE